MTVPQEQGTPNGEQAAVLLENTILAVHEGLNARFLTVLGESPGIIESTFTPGKEKLRALQEADRNLHGEFAIGFSSRPVTYATIAAQHLSIFWVAPATGLELPSSRRSIGFTERPTPATLISHPPFTQEDIVFAIARVRRQESVGLTFNTSQ